MSITFEAIIVPRTRDLGGGFEVRRVLPSGERRTVGPFVFFDQMGPTLLPAGTGLDVRPHPHIGLATVTYLFDGEILNRDSLGTVQPIRPGAVNWRRRGVGSSIPSAPRRNSAPAATGSSASRPGSACRGTAKGLNPLSRIMPRMSCR